MFKSIISIGFSLVIAGCTVSNYSNTTSEKIEICHVCEYNNDLGCMTVRVKEATPQYTYNNKTYFFCSEECQQEFLKSPDTYVK